MTTVINEALHPCAFIVSQHHGLSHEEVTIDQNQAILVGQVLGRYVVAADPTVTEAANAGNTGNGTMALASPANDTTVEEGAYRVIFTDATHFLVQAPDGTDLGEGVAGAAFANGVKFTITAGGTAFVAGDGFAVQASVDKTMALYVAHNPTATDGTQHAVAIADYPVTTVASQTAKIAALLRHAEVRQADLTFAVGITTAQLDQAISDLARAMIIMR